MGRYNADVRASQAAFERAMGRQETAIKRFESQVRTSSGAIGSQLRSLAGTFAAAFSVQQVAAMADSYTRFENALKVAGLEGARLAETQQRLFDIAQAGGTPLELLGRLYGGLASLQKDLNTTSADSIALSEAVSNSIRIQGTSAAAAAGGILGLNQALGQARVQTDEYNQILDGLRPLLQAAVDGSDKYRGRLNLLKTAIEEGEVSGRDLFVLLQGGYARLEEQSSKATLTISQAFTTLENALSSYIGKLDDSVGGTDKLVAALQWLSQNLDTVAEGLSVIAVIAFGRFAAGALVGGRALQTVSAYAAIATTSLAGTALAARAAGAALLTAFGGPVGLAIAALTLGIGYLATRATDAERAAAAQARGQEEGRKATEALREATDKLSTSTGKARDAALANAKAKREEALQSLAVAKAAIVEARAKLAAAKATFQAEKAAATAAPAPGQMGVGQGFSPSVGAAGANLRTAIDETGAAVAKFNQIKADIDAAAAAIASGPPAIGSTEDKKKKKGKGRTGPTPEEIAARQAEEIARLGQEELRAKIELTSDVEKRGELERELLRSEYKQRVDDINANKDLSDKQKAAQIAILDRLYGRAEAEGQGEEFTVKANNSLYAQLQLREQRREELKRELDRVLQGISAEDAMLALQGELATTLEERREVELRRVELAYQAERAQIQEEISLAELAKDTERLAAARKRMADLEERKPLEVEAARRRNEGPLARYRRGLDDPRTAVEEAVVQKLDAVTDGITDGIADFIGTDDPFIKSLIKILIEQVLIKPITEALSNIPGGGGIGGLFGGIISAVGGLFRATGGPVQKGQFYTVNEGASPGRVEGFVPNTGGKIIPLGQMDLLRAAPASQGVGGTIRLELSEDIDARVVRIAGPVAVEVVKASEPGLTGRAVAETRRQFSRPRP